MKLVELPHELSEKMKDYPDFYQRVWKICYSIPAGETRTYGWIAKELGKPGASRAVGTALGANPFVPTVPCHRVLRSDGGMGGYSGEGGVAAKRRLLAQEGVNFPLKPTRKGPHI